MKYLVLTVAFIATLFSCSKSIHENKSYSQLQLIGSNILSDRPQNLDSVVALIRLKGPALFETAKSEDGQVVITDEAKQAIIFEQGDAWTKIQAISPDIKLLFSYRFVLNAIAVVTPIEFYGDLSQVGGVNQVERETLFDRPLANKSTIESLEKEFKTTSVDFIGASAAQKKHGLSGKNIKVGIIDTGIDFTHSMFLGTGLKETFESIDPSLETEHFPNKKVVGGYDFAGTNYRPGAILAKNRIPAPDKNPIDEGGHGTHVAGTVAGIGDNVNTYDGVAPKADLYALKVFGANGGTSDTVVIAALEYAADPNQDLDPSDKLDIVNLSLGGDYGKPVIFYSEAIKNLTKGGVLTIAAAGNSGHNSYIVGAPSTATEALSVAASIDGMDHNWKFDSVSIQLATGTILTKVVEGNISRPISESKNVQGELVYAGVASSDFSQELKDKVKGKVALIDRGEVSFVDKLKRAKDAGAIGVIVANNKVGDAFQMGGDEKIDLPAIMITQAMGDSIKSNLNTATVTVNFGSEEKIEQPEIIDNLTNFSSRGPRSLDSLIKPEIAAPGFNIISASMGGGNEGVGLNGTSMATPHMAGVMALLKQKFPSLSPLELKDLVLNASKTISNKNKEVYPVSMQGAGRVQVDLAADSQVIVSPATISLGETPLVQQKSMYKKLTVKNLTNQEKKLSIKALNNKNVFVTIASEVIVPANSTANVEAAFTLFNKLEDKDAIKEFETRIIFEENGVQVANIPTLAVARMISDLKSNSLHVFSTNEQDAPGSLSRIEIENKSVNTGLVIPFNSLGSDDRKEVSNHNRYVLGRSCDLQSVGYRIVEKNGKEWLQFGFKLYNPVSMWQSCEVNVQIDTDGDGKADQELSGLSSDYLEGLSDAIGQGQFSALIDAKKARSIRAEHEKKIIAGEESELTYIESVIDIREMTMFNLSTIAMIEVDKSLLATLPNQSAIKIQIATLGEDGVEPDDFFGENLWLELNLEAESQSFVNLPEKVEINGNSTSMLNFTKGYGKNDLLLLYPYNRPEKVSSRRVDQQSEVLKPRFNQ